MFKELQTLHKYIHICTQHNYIILTDTIHIYHQCENIYRT